MTVPKFLIYFAFPTYFFEPISFNPKQQILNPLSQELIARVTAIAAPIFWFYQTTVLIVSTLLMQLFQYDQKSISLFTRCTQICAFSALSSLIELPHKITFGPKNPPNYFGDPNRYEFSY